MPKSTPRIPTSTTLRKAGSKTDVYAAFNRMLARCVVPDDLDALLREAAE